MELKDYSTEELKAELKRSGKHYCAECYELDEKTEEYVQKKGGVK